MLDTVPTLVNPDLGFDFIRGNTVESIFHLSFIIFHLSSGKKESIATRYLKYRRSLAREALARLIGEESADPDSTQEIRDNEEEAIERPISLNEQRISAVIAALKSTGVKRVVDLGCGEGRLIRVLLEDKSLQEIVGMDVSYRALERAQERLRLDRMPSKLKERIKLMQGR